MNELNKKLLKFAGFKPCDCAQCSEGGTFYSSPFYIYPDGSKHQAPHLGLAFCFEHLEPELYKRGLRYSLTRLQDGHKALIFAHRKGWPEVVAVASDEKPATAFCKAVELIVDKGGTSEGESL